jgi:signal transduction histidine kinase
VPRPSDRVDVGERRLQVLLGLLLLGLTAFTALAFTSPTIGVAMINERLDLIINTGASLGALAVAALAWARFRVTGEAWVFYQAGAFLALGAVNAGVLLVVTAGRGSELGFDLSNPGALPVIAFVLARFVAAALLVVGGVAALRRLMPDRRRAGLLVVAPAIMTLGLLSILRRLEMESPLPADAIAHIQRAPGDPLALSEIPLGLLGLQLGIGLLFLGAAWLAYRISLRDDRPSDAYLAAGFILAAFSQVHFAVNPGAYTGLVTTGDLLRVAFYGVLVFGVVAQNRADVRTIQEANAELVRLREAEVHRALLEERGRLAREVHDGLAQDLWYARLKQGRLAQMLTDGEPRALANDVMDAIDSGIADARQTVMAMRAGSTDAPLLEVVERYVDDFADRYAIEARFDRDGDVPPLPARTQAEVLRIVQEALNNVRKHADATVVRVRTTREDGGLCITIRDNGRGFDPSVTGPGFGLAGMQERAQLIGARLDVESEPKDGTCVRLFVPVVVPA